MLTARYSVLQSSSAFNLRFSWSWRYVVRYKAQATKILIRDKYEYLGGRVGGVFSTGCRERRAKTLLKALKTLRDCNY
jgi:hypothetical protein